MALGHARPDTDWSAPRLGSIGALVFARSSAHAGSTTIIDDARADNASNSQGSESEKTIDDLRLSA